MKNTESNRYQANIKAWIADSGLSKKDLSSKMGISRVTLHKLENGHIQLFPESVQAAANYFNVDEIEFLTRERCDHVLRDEADPEGQILAAKDYYEAKIQTFQERLDEANSKIQALQEDNERLSHELADEKDKNVTAQKIHKRLDNQIEERENTISELEAKIQDYEIRLGIRPDELSQ